MAEPTSPNWTDHDVSDPGITLLHALVYGIGALGSAVAALAVVRRRRASPDGDV